MDDTRRGFLGMTFAACFSGFAGAAPGGAPRSTYLVIYRRGSGWAEDKPMQEQPSIREHFLYMLGLYRNGVLISGGGFTDQSGGAAVFEAADDAAALAILTADPAVKSNLFRYELQGWKLNPWEEISKKRAARGE